MTAEIEKAAEAAKGYYESDSTQTFYREVWGGKYIHVGIYDDLSEEDNKLDDLPRLDRASDLATEEILRRCFPPGGPASETLTLMDLGSGTGETARVAARRHGCKVICINVASNENAENAKLSKAAGLSDKIIIPGDLSYFDTKLPAESVDVIYSQDALLHAGSDRHKVFQEVARLLKPGGLYVFSDVMQSEEATAEDIQTASNRLKVDSFSTVSEYKKHGPEYGLELLDYKERTENLTTHYNLILNITTAGRDKFEDKQFDSLVKSITAWRSLISRNLMHWGYFVFRKPASGAGDEAAKKVEQITKLAKDYYESDNAQQFYKQIWGGDWIHVGQHDMMVGDDAKLEGPARLSRASTLGTQELLRRCFPADGPAPEACTAMDFGSGIGGAARKAATDYGCKVICINVASRENAENAELSNAAGLSDKVIIPGERSFFGTELPAESVDVVFSQDSLLHAGSERHRLFTEASRLLRKGGLFAFTDLMMTEDADPKDMTVAFDRLHLDSMGTPKAYERFGKDNGLEMVEYSEMTENMKVHYQLVYKVLLAKKNDLQGMDESFVDTCVRGLASWNDLASRDLMCWGYFVFKKQ